MFNSSMMTRTLVQVFYAIPLGLMLAGLYSCSNLAESVGLNVSNIGEISKTQTMDANIYLKGKVEDRAPFLGTGAYQLQDSTGSIWVLTKLPVPLQGEQMLIQGTVRYQQIQLKELAGKDLGGVYVEELQRLERAPSPDRGPGTSK